MKKLLSCVLAVGVVAVATLVAFAFNDVAEDDFYYDAVEYLADEGIVTGYADGSFGYLSQINRAELLAIVIRAKFIGGGQEVVEDYANDSCFADVQAGQWFTKYICYAKSVGWVAGYPDNTFKPEQDVNFVEALKISMQAFGIDYDQMTDPWYKGMVEAAAAKNLIPLTIVDFDQEITRGEMADLVARMMKYNAEELDEWLGDKVDCVVTYETIEAGTNMAVECGGIEGGVPVEDEDEVACNSEADCPDPVGMMCVDQVCWDTDPCDSCPEGTDCIYDGSEGYVKLVCQDDVIGMDHGPLFVDWSFPEGEASKAFLNGDGVFEYENYMFMFSVDVNEEYWGGPPVEADFANHYIDPSEEQYDLDLFGEDECEKGGYSAFNDLVKETAHLMGVEIPMFNIDLEGEPFVWYLTIFATRNPFGWAVEDAEGYPMCSGTSMQPFAVVDNFLYDGEDTGAVLWIDECPEKGLTPEKVEYCMTLKNSIKSQIVPNLGGNQ